MKKNQKDEWDEIAEISGNTGDSDQEFFESIRINDSNKEAVKSVDEVSTEAIENLADLLR